MLIKRYDSLRLLNFACKLLAVDTSVSDADCRFCLSIPSWEHPQDFLVDSIDSVARFPVAKSNSVLVNQDGSASTHNKTLVGSRSDCSEQHHEVKVCLLFVLRKRLLNVSASLQQHG